MPTPKFDRDRAARVVTEAALMGDEAAAKRHGVGRRSVSRWRQQLSEDPNLAEVVRLKKDAIDQAWAEGIGDALKQGIDFLRRAFTEADPKDPAAIHAVAGAMKLLAEVEVMKRVLDARLAREPRELAAGEGTRVQ